MPCSMHIPSNAELVGIWERGASELPVDRALTLMSVCFPAESEDELARLSIGTRDSRLLEVFERLFGPSIEAFARCPACGESLEYVLSTHELKVPVNSLADPAWISLHDGLISLRLRLLDSSDLRAVSACPDPERAARILAQRSVVEAKSGDQTISPADLTPEALETISSALAAADPGAEMLVDLGCIACPHRWQVTLDIERFLWTKLSAAAKRLLRDVHALASAYGWREPDILALSTVRRQTYVEMAWPAF